jgi:NTE family protein
LKNKLAFVLSGGGAHGALQVGALRALFEANIYPDMMVGTSIGALNAALLAIHGMDLIGINKLIEIWPGFEMIDPMPSNFLWLGLRAMLGYPDNSSMEQLIAYITEKGLTKDIRFGDIHGVELFMVTADLNSGKTLLYGADPNQSILEGVLSSAALPPWLHPLEKNGRTLVDGGLSSNLPIEGALSQNASRIITLDLFESSALLQKIDGNKQFLIQVIQTAITRQRELELKLAGATGVPVQNILLMDGTTTPFWDFSHTSELIERGYKIACRELEKMEQPLPNDSLWKQFFRLFNFQ